MTLIISGLIAVSVSACDVRSWDAESRIRFWEKEFLEGERALQKHLPAEAVKSLDMAVIEAENLEQEDKDIRLAFTYEQLGNAYLATKNYISAQKNFTSALALYEHLSPQTNLYGASRLVKDGMAGSLTGLGIIAMTGKGFENGEKFFLKALALYEQLSAATKNNVGSNLQAQLLCKAELADAYLAVNQLDKAALLYQEVIAKIPYCISKSELQEKAIGNYAKVLRLLGKKREARSVAAGAQKTSPAKINWENAFQKATDLTHRRDFENAEKEINAALPIAMAFGSQSSELNLTLRAQSELLYEQGRYNAARISGEQALAIKQTELGAADTEVERDLLMLIKISVALENWHTAKEFLDRQYRLETKSQLPRLTQISENRAYMALVSEKLGQIEAADAFIRSAQTIVEQTPKRPRTASCLAIIGSIYDYRTAFTKAQSCYEQALEILHANNSDRRMLEPQILLALGNSYARSNAGNKAKDSYYKALGLLNNKSDPLVATILAHYALTELKVGSKEKAAKLASQAIESMPNYADAVHADFTSTITEYKKLSAK